MDGDGGDGDDDDGDGNDVLPEPSAPSEGLQRVGAGGKRAMQHGRQGSVRL